MYHKGMKQITPALVLFGRQISTNEQKKTSTDGGLSLKSVHSPLILLQYELLDICSSFTGTQIVLNFPVLIIAS